MTQFHVIGTDIDYYTDEFQEAMITAKHHRCIMESLFDGVVVKVRDYSDCALPGEVTVSCR
jgi:hypothetical protein